MGLSRAVFEAHLKGWSEELRRTNRPYREYWPSHLFRHEPVQTAATILQTGHLLSRNDANREAPDRPDIAAPEVIATTGAAYDKARLYFRPLNPTQYWVEGVRSEEELWSASGHVHAPVLVMLVFDAEPILTSAGVAFSNGNVQRTTRTSTGNNDRFFLNIGWDRVYHDGPWGQDGEAIRSKRWQWKVNLDDGEYLCRIYLHNCLAYEAPFLIDRLPF